jgi:hypothetical protein
LKCGPIRRVSLDADRFGDHIAGDMQHVQRAVKA